VGEENGAQLRPASFDGAWMMRTSILRLQLFLSLTYLALSHDHEHNN
jgi:hypothetical protein